MIGREKIYDDTKKFEKSIVVFFNSISSIQYQPQTLQDLQDGRTFMESIREIYEGVEELQTRDISKFKFGQKLSSVEIYENLKLLMEQLEFYYERYLNRIIQSAYIDTVLLSKDNTMEIQIIKIFELLLGMMVQCQQQTVYVGVILGMSDDDQATMMVVVEQTISVVQRNSMEPNDNFRDTLPKRLKDSMIGSSFVDESLNPKNTYSLQNELIAQLDEIQKKNIQLKAEVTFLMEEQEQLQNERDELKTDNFKLNQEIRKRNILQPSSQMLESQYHITSVDQFQSQLRMRDEKIKLLQYSLDENRLQYTEQIQSLEEEVNLAKIKLNQNAQIVSQTEFYQSKMEEFQSLTEDYKKLKLQFQDAEVEIKARVQEVANLNNVIVFNRERNQELTEKNTTQVLEITHKDHILDQMRQDQIELEESVAKKQMEIDELNKKLQAQNEVIPNSSRLFAQSLMHSNMGIDSGQTTNLLDEFVEHLKTDLEKQSQNVDEDAVLGIQKLKSDMALYHQRENEYVGQIEYLNNRLKQITIEKANAAKEIEMWKFESSKIRTEFDKLKLEKSGIVFEPAVGSNSSTLYTDNQAESLKQEIQELKQTIENKESQTVNLKKEIDELKTKVVEQSESIKENVIWEQKLKDMQNEEIFQRNQEINLLTTILVELNMQLAEKQQEVQQLYELQLKTGYQQDSQQTVKRNLKM